MKKVVKQDAVKKVYHAEVQDEKGSMAIKKVYDAEILKEDVVKKVLKEEVGSVRKVWQSRTTKWTWSRQSSRRRWGPSGRSGRSRQTGDNKG